MPKNDTFETEQLTDSAYYILLALLEERHGYAIMKYIEELTNESISIGAATMYTLLKKMVKTEFIQQLQSEDRTKQYKITDKGFLVLKKELLRREQMVEDGKKIFATRGITYGER